METVTVFAGSPGTFHLPALRDIHAGAYTNAGPFSSPLSWPVARMAERSVLSGRFLQPHADGVCACTPHRVSKPCLQAV